MYLRYFDLKRAPFGIAPDPHFLYLSPQHGEGLAHLRYGMEQKKGFVVLTGEVGCGKTILLQTLLKELPEPRYRKIFLKNPKVDVLDLYLEILRNFQFFAEIRSPLDALEVIGAVLRECESAGQTIVLIIDEAQNLSMEMLEQIRMLSNLEAGEDRVMQILLVGQPELRRLLRKKKLRQFRQRITVYYNLTSLKFLETIRYINYRLAFSGSGGEVRFSMPALIALHWASGGVPRIINSICDKALLSAFVRGGDGVTYRDARRAIYDFRRL
ncbi:MAG: AAA family ATPase [Puniceicoccales bacterium]|jgi:general secretion pathway protein A|nr:AAA family ATPase [Puniceicoccales bacterium]